TCDRSSSMSCRWSSCGASASPPTASSRASTPLRSTSETTSPGSAPPSRCAGDGGFDQACPGHRVVAEPGLEGTGEPVGDELRHDLMAGVWEVRMGAPGNE